MGYFLAALPQAAETPAYRVIDTRGPWFLGSARWRIPLSALYLVAAAFRIAWAGIAGRPSLLHVNITGRGSTSRKLVLTAIARAVALPYVLHIHDYDYAADVRARGGLMRRLVRGMFAAAAQTIVAGDGGGADSARRARAAGRAHPGPAERRARSAPRAAGGRDVAAADPVHLVFLGYLSARKGVPELLEALASPALAALPWRATLAGGGPVDEFRARAAALGLADRVAFPGWIDQPAASALCAAADILVLPSHAEGLAMSVLEGLAHGLAVVATPVGAHAEVIEPEQSGLLMPPGDVAALGVGAHPRDRRSERCASACAPAPASASSTVTTCGLTRCAWPGCMSGCSAVVAYWARLKPSPSRDRLRGSVTVRAGGKGPVA